VIVERDRLARLGLQRVLSTSAALQVSGCVGTIREAQELPASTPVEVVLAGADVLDMDGVEGIDRLLTRFTRARVVLLGAAESSSVMTAALRRGADGYLPREISAAGLVRALQGVAHGEAAVPRALVQVVVNALRLGTATGAAEDLLLRLSPREQDVLTEMVRGRTNAEIAQRLGLKESTVKTHVSKILTKTGARSRFALQLGASAGRASA
jgi:DNA-binding NarL/FixJ family response regulator